MSLLEERRDTFCWHKDGDGQPVRLYDCQDPQHTTPLASPARSDLYREERVVFFHGEGKFYVPVTDRDSDMFGGSEVHNLPACAHRHTTIGAAQRCGARMTARAVAGWNREHGL